MSTVKRFRSNKGEIRVTTLSGHAAIIGTEFRELPEILWSSAYAQGAISEDMVSAPSMKDYIEEKKLEQAENEKKELAEIKGILKSLYDNPKDYVNSQGQLIHRKAVQLIGRPVKKDLLDSIWSEIASESEE